MTASAIHWFRQDLRMTDNPALLRACELGSVLPIYILDDVNSGEWALGEASRCWLHRSLEALNTSLNGALNVYCGDPSQILPQIIQRIDAQRVTWTRCYEPWRLRRDQRLKQNLKEQGIDVISENGSLLWEPWQVNKADGTPYRVFTPFYNNGCAQAPRPRHPCAKAQAHWCQDDDALSLRQLCLWPKREWGAQMMAHWPVGEHGAAERLTQFVTEGLDDYKVGRDFPAQPHVSRLSAHLHFGEISPHQIWHRLHELEQTPNRDHFCRELGWREFSYHQLYAHHTLPTHNVQSKFDGFQWEDSLKHLRAWQLGMTGVPFVDAGLRELWQTGTMHNRVRMVVASYLVKNLRVHWQHGASWFWQTLVDADLASNSASWQWVAGCGFDAAPYFRIFNPVTQGKKFDPDGTYIRQYLPELAQLPTKYLFAPWEAPHDVLSRAGVTLGSTYPHPLVDLKHSRQVALEAFKKLS